MSSQYPSAELSQRWPELAAKVVGSGRSFILLHGGVGSWTHWIRNIEELARHFRVIAFDLPGYGESPDTQRQIKPDAYVDWVVSTVRHVAGGDCELAGFSFGGALAAQVAAELGAVVRRLSLLAPGGFGLPASRIIPTSKVPPPEAPNEIRRAAVAANLGSWMLSEPPAAGDEAVDLQIGNIDRTRFDSRRVSLRETLIGDLSKFPAPVQLIWGDRDRLAHPSIAARVEACRAARPDVAVQIVPNAGHWVQFERPNEVNRLLLDFHLV